MFSKILIANRGEIACRIIRSARKMGIATVAVFSDADRDAEHVRMADEAVHIGPSAATGSYLRPENIINACEQTGAQAVHPGYGFLSERAAFCEALESLGIAFIGPKTKSIEAMGDKITSKVIAAKAGVSTVPGFMGVVSDADDAAQIAKSVGYPVMIKASAGGGGKGMRIAWNDEEARQGFERSRSEAASAFGDDRIFIEKFIEQPRHIEIQILADAHGTTLYLGERECSVQRRNQKVVEEAPSMFLDDATRKAMGEQAVALARAVNYQSAGTVEFIVDKDRNFYFLEMNTRLQVEHPVTELVTGFDIVEQMIRIAAGEKLALKQGDIHMNGWAIESRLYAEDPCRNFLPSIGRLTRYRPPLEGKQGDVIIRNDTGVTEGSEISIYYDPMIAKLCTWAPTRLQAIDAMADAFDHFLLEGIGNNLSFCSALMQHPRWREGRLSTAFISEEYAGGFKQPLPGRIDAKRFAMSAAVFSHLLDSRGARISGARPSLSPKRISSKIVSIGEHQFQTEVTERSGEYAVSLNGKVAGAVMTDWQPGNALAKVFVDGQGHAIKVDAVSTGFRLRQRGFDVVASVLPPRVAKLASLMSAKAPPDSSGLLLCPMPGLIIAVHVAEGDLVQEGQVLVIVEAMKMENVLRAERSGKIARIAARVGESMAVDDVIMEFEK